MGLKSLDPKSLITTNRSKAQVVEAKILRINGRISEQDNCAKDPSLLAWPNQI
jgi:hypothetical protein